MIATIRHRAILSLIAAAGISLLPGFGSARAGPALVLDVDSGKVLHAEQATTPWFPASVTKLMTAYVALREVQAGRITMDTPLIVSPRAAAAAPSKIGFKPGMEVTLENALSIIMVKSANDVSTTIAEGIGGSVETFAAMMNREAALLGMVDSNFTNPHGLPDENNRSSARDLALLGRALLRSFPEHEDLWGIGAIKLGKRVMQNTNGLVGRYPGTLGMKTGFICASGFNVVAAAERDGRRLIAVVLGSHSAAARTIRTAELLDKGFSSYAFAAPAIESLPPGVGSPPDLRPEICGKRRGVPAEDDGETPVAASLAGPEGIGDNPLKNLFQPTVTPGITSVRGEGGRYALAPRARAEPIVVHAGRKAGSTALARGPVGSPAGSEVAGGGSAGGVPTEATAFAPAPAAAGGQPLKEGPLLLQGGGQPSLTNTAKLVAPPAKPLSSGAKPLAVSTGKPLDKPAAKPLTQPRAKPVATTAKPLAQPVAKPITKPLANPAPKPAAAPPKPPAKPAAAAPLRILPAKLQPRS